MQKVKSITEKPSRKQEIATWDISSVAELVVITNG